MLAPRSASTLLLLLASTIGSVACEAQTAGPPAVQAAAKEAGAEASATEEPGYTVDVELAPQTARGREAIAHVRVRPKAPWHMNLDYPAKLRLQAPADVELVAPVLRKDDAQRFDDQALEFSVLFTPKADGARTIEGQLDFAVCGDDACGAVTESLQLAFEVGCRTEDSGLC